VEWMEIASGAVLVGVLAVLGAFFAWRQVGMLRRLRGPHSLSDDEVRWRRGQAWRRLAGSALMLILAGLFAWAALFMRPQAQHLADVGPAGDTPEDQQFLPIYIGVWVGDLLLLVALIFLVAADIWSTRLYSLRQQRKILDDKRAMLEREVSRLRQERNGHN
jgi:hypothetical protein